MKELYILYLHLVVTAIDFIPLILIQLTVYNNAKRYHEAQNIKIITLEIIQH